MSRTRILTLGDLDEDDSLNCGLAIRHYDVASNSRRKYWYRAPKTKRRLAWIPPLLMP
jgi:hypothetical protein